MGSSSSRPQQQYYYYPQGGYPAQESYAHTYAHPSQGQFGYYYQQVGNDPTQVRAIPGYYYPPAQQPSHRRHNSAPGVSNTQRRSPQRAEHATEQAAAPSGSSPAAAPPPVQPTEAPADPGPSEAPPPQESGAPDGAPSVPEKEPEPALQPEPAPEPAPELAPAPAPAHVTPGMTNSLPPPPQDVFNRDAYRDLRRAQTTGAAGPWNYYGAPVASVSYKPQLRSQYRPKRVETLRPPRPHEELRRREKKSSGIGGGAFKLLRSFTLPGTSTNKTKKLKHSPPAYYQPGMAYLPSRSGSLGSNPLLGTAGAAGPPPLSGPPIIVRLDSPLNPTSRHKILYKKKLYPSAAHLFEAQKFLKHSPELAERIRSSSGNAVEMSMLSRAFETDGKARRDWPLVWRDKMDEVLYMKFTQHPDLRAELMATGYSPLIDGNEPVRPDAEGVNELGKALVRLRERLRKEGAR